MKSMRKPSSSLTKLFVVANTMNINSSKIPARDIAAAYYSIQSKKNPTELPFLEASHFLFKRKTLLRGG